MIYYHASGPCLEILINQISIVFLKESSCIENSFKHLILATIPHLLYWPAVQETSSGA